MPEPQLLVDLGRLRVAPPEHLPGLTAEEGALPAVVLAGTIPDTIPLEVNTDGALLWCKSRDAARLKRLITSLTHPDGATIWKTVDPTTHSLKAPHGWTEGTEDFRWEPQEWKTFTERAEDVFVNDRREVTLLETCEALLARAGHAAAHRRPARAVRPAAQRSARRPRTPGHQPDVHQRRGRGGRRARAAARPQDDRAA